MDTYQLHYTSGAGGAGLPKGAPRVSSGNANEIIKRVANLRSACEHGLAHSISVFDVTDGRRDNVTGNFVTFDSRPRRPQPGKALVAAVAKRLERANG